MSRRVMDVKSERIYQPYVMCMPFFFGGDADIVKSGRKVTKGEWWMPRLLQAMKDVISCEKPR